MILRYIALGLEYNWYAKADNNLRYDFQLHTRFISNYLSKAIRKYKYKTENFNMISIALLPENEVVQPKITAVDVLEAYLPFDRDRYERIKGTKNCDYYLELFENGFIKIAEFKPIPLDILLGLLKTFKDEGCKNEWEHKKKRFKQHDLNIVLNCEFTTNYFQLRVVITRISTKQILINGIVIRTEPDEVLFDKMYKDILIDERGIVITDSSDSARVIIDKEKTIDSILEFEIQGDSKIKEILSYGI